MEPIDFATILKDATPGEFVALSKKREIVGSGKTREEATEAAQNNGENDPLVFKVPAPCALILQVAIALCLRCFTRFRTFIPTPAPPLHHAKDRKPRTMGTGLLPPQIPRLTF